MITNKSRKSGYYWVEYDDEKVIAWYDDIGHPFKPGVRGYWHTCCSVKDILEDTDFTWISDRLLNPPKIKG